MGIKKKLSFKLICLLTASIFLFETCFIKIDARAELPCWNDGSIDYINGGSNIINGAKGGNFNPLESEKVGEPVNVATGNYYFEHTDIAIASTGLTLQFNRYYNNQDTYKGPFGIGTNHSYNTFLVQTSEGNNSFITRRNPDGSKDKFTKNANGSYSSPAGVFDTLSKEGENYVITTKHKSICRFNKSGYIESITDRNSNKLNFNYDTVSGVLVKVIDDKNRFISFEYNSDNKISQTKDFTGRAWNYDYTLDGDLKSMTLPGTSEFPSGTTTTYAYLNHKMISATDAKGNTYLNISYDASNRVSKMIFGPDTYSFAYYSGLTTYYDRKGNKTDYYLNSDGTTNRKIQYLSGENLVTNYEYNSDKLLTRITYPEGNYFYYLYDNKGNLTKNTSGPKSLSLRPSITSQFTYEPNFNFIKTATSYGGNTTTYYYDYEEASLGDLNADGDVSQANGNLIKVSYPEVDGKSNEIKFTYTSTGQIETLTDASGSVTKYEYSASNGYLTKVIGACGSLNITTQISYDSLGNVAAVTDPNSNTTFFEYDNHNSLIKTVKPAPFNYITTYTYDANDNLIETAAETGIADSPWQRNYYTYDVLDRLTQVKDALGNITAYTYDANDNKSVVKDAESNSINYSYDKRDLLLKTTDALGNATEFAYNKNGNLTELTDANFNKTTYVYDEFSRLVQKVYADSSKETYSYDIDSNLISKTLASGNTINYSYDVLNRLKQKTYPDAKTVSYSYDASSRLKEVLDENGKISYEYDTAGRLIKTTYPDGKSVSNEYDNAGNRTKLIYPDASYINYTYDALNRLNKINDSTGAEIAAYTYDNLSRRVKTNLGNGTEAIYTYDAVNRLTQLKNRKTGQANNFSQYNYTYDKAGNRTSLTAASVTNNYAYDKIYQLTQTTNSADSNYTSYNYDETGNRTTVTDNSGTITYSANKLNQYTQTQDSANITKYSYDANGNIIGDGSKTYTYNYENQLTRVIATLSEVEGEAIYSYDAFGRRIKKEVTTSPGHKVTNKYIYDGDRIISEYDGSDNLLKKYIYGLGIDEPVCIIARSDSDEAIYYYHSDGLGSVTDITDSSGNVIEKYQYDEFGKPSIKDGTDNNLTKSSIGNRFMFTGREYDAETNLYYYRARYYSPELGRFLQRDPIGYYDSMNLYAYCNNNPVNYIDPMGLFWNAQGANEGLLNAIKGAGIGTLIVLGTLTFLPTGPATFILTGLGITGAGALGLTTGQVITGKTLTGEKIGDKARTRMLVESLLGWIMLGGIWAKNLLSTNRLYVYRQGKFANGEWKGNFIKGTKWASENPATTPDFAIKYGLPAENSGKPDWIVGGRVKGGYKTGPVPASHNNPNNTGGATEIIPDDVLLDWFHMP